MRASLLLAVVLGGCEDAGGDERVTYCDCAAPTLYVTAPPGTRVEIAEGGCTGRCESTAASACAQLAVTSSSPGTCTVRATDEEGAVETLTVTFVHRGCCGVQPDRRTWTVGESPPS